MKKAIEFLNDAMGNLEDAKAVIKNKSKSLERRIEEAESEIRTVITFIKMDERLDEWAEEPNVKRIKI